MSAIVRQELMLRSGHKDREVPWTVVLASLLPTSFRRMNLQFES